MKTLQTYTSTALLLLSICCTGFGAYSVGQPISFDSTVVKQSTGRLQTNPVVAGAATSFMAVWVDMRDAGNIADLFAARIAPVGSPADPGNIRLTSHACVMGKPDIAFNGQEYFIVYANATGPTGSSIYGIRLSVDGAVLSGAPIAISSYPNARDPRVSWDGSRWIVVWSGDAPGAYCGIYLVRMSPTGTVLDPTPIVVAAGRPTWDGYACTNPDVASVPGARSLIVWTVNSTATGSSNDLYAAAFVPDLGIVNSFGSPIYSGTASQDTPACCWAGDHFKVVWADGEPAGREIKGMRIDGCGVPMEMLPWTVSSTAERQYEPRIAWNGTNCIVTWTRRVGGLAGCDIYAGRLDEAGAPLDGDGFMVGSSNGQQMRPDIALMSDGPSPSNSALVCWMDDRASMGKSIAEFGTHVCQTVITFSEAGPTVGSGTRLAESASQHKAVCSAYSGQKFLICWEEWTEAGRMLRGTLADPNTGQPIASTPFDIMSVPELPTSVSAFWNGENFLILWAADYDLKALRISPTGAVLDPTPITIVDGTMSTGTPSCWSIATDGEKCLIPYKIGSKYRAALVSRDCTLITDVAIYTGLSSYDSDIAVCWVGQYYVLAWRHPTTSSSIAYATISATGGLYATKQITDASKPNQFRLAWNGQTVLLVSRGSEIHSYSGWDYVRRQFGSGPVPAPVPLVVTTNAEGQENMNLFWDGIDYVLTWNIANPDAACGAAMQYDLQFTRINSNNQLVGVNGVNVLSSASSELGGTMCAGPTGRMLAAFASYEDEPYQSTRVKGLYIDNQMNLTSLGQLRGLYEGAYITMPGQIVSASFPDRFYVQNGRMFGVGVTSAGSIAPGSMVTFTGQLKKINGEALIDASAADVSSTGNPTPEPIAMSMISLGGIAPTSGYTTVTGGCGLYNIGLLVKTWGRVTAVGEGCFYLDDGSNLSAASGNMGVKVYGTLPVVGAQYAEVTGVSGAELNGSEIMRVIRSTDVQAISAP